MKQEDKRHLQDKLCHERDKELLLKDLCARLPYRVKVKFYDHWVDEYEIIPLTAKLLSDTVYIGDIKPYLFPLSSLTEKQRNEISQLLIDTQNTFSPYGEINTKGCDNLFVCSVKQSNALIKYCLNNHLDINIFFKLFPCRFIHS